MPLKTVTCRLCGKEVSKRKSLDLKELGGESGRACRYHEEVQRLLEVKAQREEMEKTFQEANRAMLILMAVAEIRVNHSLTGAPLYFLFGRLRNLPKDVQAEIKAKVEEQGAKMSIEEMGVSLMGALDLQRRQQERQKAS